MSREKQIEEMIEHVREVTDDCQNCNLYKDRLCDYNCDLCEAIQLACEALYNAGYRKSEWISVDERLPEKADTYLVSCKDGLVTMAYFCERFNSIVTHWMPLPEAPKMKGGAE